MDQSADRGDPREDVPRPSQDPPAHFHVVRGKASVLRMHAVLMELSARCEQTGAMDHIALFLDSPMNEKKTPYLVLATASGEAEPFRLKASDLQGAALVYEYDLFGFRGIFVTDDGSGGRTVVAPAELRSEITIRVCEQLMLRGAKTALLSYKEEVNPRTQDREIAATVVRGAGLFWGSQVRDMSTYLSVGGSYEATLATLGKHTRRNLRYYRRRAATELRATFYPEAGRLMSKADFLALNRASTHPVEARAMVRRYDDLHRIPDSFCIGMRAGDGRWLSLMGGRRHHGWTEVDWQVNRGGLDRFSLGTAMRSYFLEHEVELGTERLYFEGGTPHTMRHSLETEKAVDIIAVRPSLRMRLIRAYARSRYGKKNFLLQTLANRAIAWQRI